MEATSITQTKNMIIDRIKQPLSERIECTGAEIQCALINGAIDAASEAICDLSSWFEDLAWEVYLTSLFQTTVILIIDSEARCSKRNAPGFISDNLDHYTNWDKNSPCQNKLLPQKKSPE